MSQGKYGEAQVNSALVGMLDVNASAAQLRICVLSISGRVRLVVAFG
jgi:hypothetical protein